VGIVLDVSNHDFSTFSEYCFRDNGVERLIIGCWDFDVTRSMLRRARTVGILVEDLYAYLYFGLPHEGREVENALRLAREEGGIRRIWLDVEATGQWEAPGMTPPQRISAVRGYVNRITSVGIEPGIYTGRWYWPTYMANTTEFSHLKLWHAEYGPNSEPAPPIRQVSYGGWKEVSVHQYTSMYFLCGRRRDANYWWISDTGKSPFEEEDPMSILDKVRNDPTFAKALAEALVSHKEARNAIGTTAKDLPVHLAMDSAARASFENFFRPLIQQAMVGSFGPTIQSAVDTALKNVAKAAELGTDDLGNGLRAIWRRLQKLQTALAAAADALDKNKPY